MDSLFSHAPEPAPDDDGLRNDVEVSRVVPRETGEAATGFLEYIHLWWPSELTRYGAGTYLELEDGNLVETGPDGGELIWASVAGIEADGAVRLVWHYGQATGRPGQVVVRFEETATHESAGPAGGTSEAGSGTVATEVRLRHTHITAGDEFGVPDFRTFWEQAMTQYARFMGAR